MKPILTHSCVLGAWSSRRGSGLTQIFQRPEKAPSGLHTGFMDTRLTSRPPAPHVYPEDRWVRPWKQAKRAFWGTHRLLFLRRLKPGLGCSRQRWAVS